MSELSLVSIGSEIAGVAGGSEYRSCICLFVTFAGDKAVYAVTSAAFTGRLGGDARIRVAGGGEIGTVAKERDKGPFGYVKLDETDFIDSQNFELAVPARLELAQWLYRDVACQNDTDVFYVSLARTGVRLPSYCVAGRTRTSGDNIDVPDLAIARWKGKGSCRPLAGTPLFSAGAVVAMVVAGPNAEGGHAIAPLEALLGIEGVECPNLAPVSPSPDAMADDEKSIFDAVSEVWKPAA